MSPIDVQVLPLKKRAAYIEAMEDAAHMIQRDPPARSMAGKELDAISKAIEAYEAEHYAMRTLSQQ
jgi:antitoxin component HigA of HigAB toxin-antitoxin module